MIHFYRTASVQPGRLADAIAHAKAIATHLETNHGYKVAVAVPFGGLIGRIQWCTKHKDMAELESRLLKMNADAKMGELGKAGAALFLPGTIKDTMWRTV